MSLLKAALEELNVDEAIEMVQKEDSTDPVIVDQVTSYKEHLERLNERNEESGSDTSDTSDIDDDSGDDEPDDTEDGSDNSEEGEDKTDSTDDSDDTKEDDTDTEDKDTDKDDKAEEASKEIEKTTDDLDKSLEHFSWAKEAYDDMAFALNHGRPEYFSKEKHLAKLNIISDVYKPSGSFKTALESFSTSAGYSVAVSGLKTSLEGIKEFLSNIIEKIIEFIKRLVKWISDYLSFDAEKDRETMDRFATIKKQALELKAKTEELNEFEKEANASLMKKTVNAGSLGTGSGIKESTDVVEDIKLTCKVLKEYWKNTVNFANSYLLKNADKPERLQKFASGSTNILYTVGLNVCYQNYEPVSLRKATNRYKNLYSAPLPESFEVFTSDKLLCGNKRLYFIMPEDYLKNPVQDSMIGRMYSVGLTPDYQFGASKVSIKLSTDAMVITHMVNELTSALSAKAQVNQIVDSVSSKLKELSTYLQKLSGNGYGNANTNTKNMRVVIDRIRFNIEVLNNILDKPLFATVKHLTSMLSSVDSFSKSNMAALNDVCERVDKRKEQLGI